MRFISIIFDEEVHRIALEDDEQYKFSDRWPAYLFTDKGRAYSFTKKSWMKGGINRTKNGYLRWYLVDQEHRGTGIGKQWYAQDVIWEVFKFPLAKGNEIHHKDFNPLNNELDNLVFCENRAEHAAIHREAGRPFGSRTKKKENDTLYNVDECRDIAV